MPRRTRGSAAKDFVHRSSPGVQLRDAYALTLVGTIINAVRDPYILLCSKHFWLFPTLQDIDGAWAGGRGFKNQPYITVIDAGGEVVTGDSKTMVTASVTPSLMVSLVDLNNILPVSWDDVRTHIFEICITELVL